MKCQILFSGKNKSNIMNLSSAEFAQTVVKVKQLNYGYILSQILGTKLKIKLINVFHLKPNRSK